MVGIFRSTCSRTAFISLYSVELSADMIFSFLLSTKFRSVFESTLTISFLDEASPKLMADCRAIIFTSRLVSSFLLCLRSTSLATYSLRKKIRRTGARWRLQIAADTFGRANERHPLDRFQPHRC